MTDGTAAVQSGYVGARVQRVEDPKFLRGMGQYVDDIELPRMLHAAFLRSPYGHARIGSIDAGAARALPGVHLVITGAELAETTGPVFTPPGLGLEGVASVTRRILAVDKVRFVGEPVAIVIGDSRYIAEDALELIEVEWEELPSVVDPRRAISAGAPTIHDEVPDNNLGQLDYEHGDVQAAFDSAAYVFRKRLSCARHHAVPLEGRGCIASWDVAEDRGILWTSNQMPHLIRSLLTMPLLATESQFRVIAPAVGGGFGNKSNFFMEDAVVLCASRQLGCPVKWIEDRAENLSSATHGKETLCDAEIAFDADGRILAMRGSFIGNVGAYTIFGPWFMVDSLPAASLLPGPYAVQDLGWTVVGVLTNKSPTAPYRGVGMSNGHAVREVLLDDAAREMGIDPVELRMRNLIPPDPGYVSASGMRYDGGSYEASLRRAAELAEYDTFREHQARARGEGRYLGIGFSPFVEPTGFGSAAATATGLPSAFFDAATVTMQPDGSVTVRTGLHNHGQGHETSLAQVAADTLGVPLSTIRVVEGDTETAPFGMGTYASRSAVIGGGTIQLAATEVREKLAQFAAQMLEANPDDIVIRDGKATVRGVPGVEIPVPQIAGFAYYGGDARPPGLEPALTATRSYDPPQTYSNGCVVALVEVDVETGGVKLDQIIAVEDCGTMINPMIVDGQVHGAIAQGIGSALLEELVYSDAGQLLTGTLVDYLYPSMMEVPPMVVDHFETPSDVTLGGIKGMGEGGTIAAPAAVLNAIADALSPFGVRIERMPMGPNHVLDAIRDGRRREAGD